MIRSATICTTNSSIGNFSNAWVMIAGYYGLGWSQVGWERTYGHPIRWFSQHYGEGTYATRYSTNSITNELGVRHTFRVLWIQSCVCMRAYIGTTLWASSFFNPFDSCSLWGPRPFSPQFAGEVGFRESGVPGSPAAPTPLTALGAQRFSDGVVVPMPCTMTSRNDNGTDWGLTASSCDDIEFWTK